MSPNRDGFTNYIELVVKIPVRVRNDQVIYAVGKGDVSITLAVDHYIVDATLHRCTTSLVYVRTCFLQVQPWNRALPSFLMMTSVSSLIN